MGEGGKNNELKMSSKSFSGTIIHLHPPFFHFVIHSFFTRNIDQTGRACAGGNRKRNNYLYLSPSLESCPLLIITILISPPFNLLIHHVSQYLYGYCTTIN